MDVGSDGVRLVEGYLNGQQRQHDAENLEQKCAQERHIDGADDAEYQAEQAHPNYVVILVFFLFLDPLVQVHVGFYASGQAI